jgi:hypothetical protein
MAVHFEFDRSSQTLFLAPYVIVVMFARMKMLHPLATDVGAETTIASNMEYHTNVAVSRFVSGASAEIVAFGVVTNRLASVLRHQSSMALREVADVETELGPFGPVNITMKIALQQFMFQCVCVIPILVDFCYVLGYSTQETFSKPFSHALMISELFTAAD